MKIEEGSTGIRDVIMKKNKYIHNIFFNFFFNKDTNLCLDKMPL